MLKIKDNVDLRELEKFGYRLSNNEYVKELDLDYDNDIIFIDIKTREIYLDTYEFSNEYLLEVIKDLIQAGLVEKEENND